MPTKVTMEALSPTMEEGRVVKWLKSEGDSIKGGDILAEVETDKAVMELVARGDGVLRKIVAGEGTTAPVGALLGVIAAKDEDIEELLKKAGGSAAPAKEAAGSAAQSGDGGGAKDATRSKAGEAESAAGADTPAPAKTAGNGTARTDTAENGRVRSSPLARRLAADAGLDLERIAGSGPGGRIIKRDIEAAREAGTAAGATATARSGAEYDDIPLTQIRKTIARRLGESIGPIPTFYLTAEFDLERAAEMRGAMAELGDEFKVSFNDIIMKAVATALAQHPECNAHWLGDRIRQFNRVHLGMAVATDDGLIVPVIRDADAKSLSMIAREARDLARRARERKLKPEEYTGSTFSVSNLGMFAIDQFTAIINPPEAGILAMGAIQERPVRSGEGVDFRRSMRVTMSCDHRVIDGAVGSRFLITLRRMLENPLMLVY